MEIVGDAVVVVILILVAYRPFVAITKFLVDRAARAWDSLFLCKECKRGKMNETRGR